MSVRVILCKCEAGEHHEGHNNHTSQYTQSYFTKIGVAMHGALLLSFRYQTKQEQRRFATGQKKGREASGALHTR
jgi:hypothetical protein